MTGQTVAAETRTLKDGSYVLAANSAAENILTLDSQIQENTSQIDKNTNDLLQKLDSSLNNLSVDGKKNISSLIQVKSADSTYLAVNSNIDTDGTQNITLKVNADGTISGNNDKGIVTGETVATALNNSAQKILSDISKAGSTFNTEIRNQAKSSISVKAEDGQNLITVSKSPAADNSIDTYSINLSLANSLATDQTGLITADVLRKEVRVTSDRNYIKQSATVSDNLTALDTELNKIGTAFTSIQNFEDLSATAIKNLNKYANDSFTIQTASNSPLSISNSDNASGIRTWVIDVNDSGKIAEGDTNLVTGDTVWSYVKDFTTGAGFAAIDASNINTSSWISKLGTPSGTSAISQDNTAFISGAEVFREVRVDDAADGTNYAYLSKDNTASENLVALDLGLQKLKDLSDISDAGKSTIGNIAADALNINGSTHVSVAKDTGARSWTISIEDSGKIAEGDTNLVTGDTVWSYVKDFTTGAGFADIDASNINTLSWISKLGTPSGTSAISQDNASFISGAEVFNEVRVSTAADGTSYAYLSTDKSAAENLAALDLGIQSLRNFSDITDEGKEEIGNIAADALAINGGKHVTVAKDSDTKAWTISVDDSGTIAQNDEKLVTGNTVWNYVAEQTANLAGIDASNIQKDAWLSALGTSAGSSAISAQNINFITGAEIYAEVRPAQNGNYVQDSETVGSNLLLLDKKVYDVNSVVFNADGELQLASADLSNLSEAGKTQLAKTAQSAVKVTSSSSVLTVASIEENEGNTISYVLSLTTSDNSDDKSALVTNGTLTSVLESQSGDFSEQLIAGLGSKADLDASNISGDYLTTWQNKLSTGSAIAAGNTGLVTGEMVHAEVRPAADGKFVSTSQNTGSNLTSLDEGLNKIASADASVVSRTNWLDMLSGSISSSSDGFITGKALYEWSVPASGTSYLAISPTNSVAQNLVALDTKLGSVQQGSIDTSLGNLTDAGKDVISGIAAESISISSANSLILVENDKSGSFTLTAQTGSVSQNSSGLVTGGDVWNAIQDAAVSDDKIQNIVNNAITSSDTFQTAINQAVSNNENIQNAITEAITNTETVEKLSTSVASGQIASDDSHAVSGGTVYNYLHSDTVMFGANVSATGEHALALGTGSAISGASAGGFGYGNSVAASKAYAFGTSNNIASEATGSFAVGNSNTISGQALNTFVFGSNVSTSATNAVVLGYGSEGVDNAVSVGSAVNKRKVVNVAAGDVYYGSTDAVNGGQLFETNQAIAETARSINSVASRLQKEINRSAANAAAMAALHPLGLDEDHKWSAAAGVGNYSGEQALAIGVFYKPTENLMFNVAGSAATGGDTMVNAGMSYRFGAPSSYNAMSNSQLKGKVIALSSQNDALQAQLDSALVREDTMRKRVQASQDALEELKAEIEMLKKAVGLKGKAVKAQGKQAARR